MGKLRVISVQGDHTVVWDDKKAEEGDLEAKAAVKEAERIFEEARAQGATAFSVQASEPGERIEVFDEKAEQIVMVPRMVGG